MHGISLAKNDPALCGTPKFAINHFWMGLMNEQALSGANCNKILLNNFKLNAILILLEVIYVAISVENSLCTISM